MHDDRVLSITRAYAQAEIDDLIVGVRKQIDAAAAEYEFRGRRFKEDNPVLTRLHVSPAQFDKSIRQLMTLVEARLYSLLMVSKECNEQLGDDSPYHDDWLIKAHPQLANVDLYLDAMHRAQGFMNPPAPRERATPSVRTGTAHATDGPRSEKAERNEAPREASEADSPAPEAVKPATETAGKSDLRLLKGGAARQDAEPTNAQAEPDAANPPEDMTGMEKIYKWAADCDAWNKARDLSKPMPEYPPDVLEEVRRRAENEPAFKEAYESVLEYIQRREAHLATLAKGGQIPATS